MKKKRKMKKRFSANHKDSTDRILLNMPHIVLGTFLQEYFGRIIEARDNPSELSKLIGEKADKLLIAAMRKHYERDLVGLEAPVLHTTIREIIGGIQEMYGPVKGPFTTRVIYQVMNNGRIVDGSLHSRNGNSLSDKLAPQFNPPFSLDDIPSIVRYPAFPNLEKKIMDYLQGESKGTSKPEVLSQALEVGFPRKHESGIERIIFSIKVGEKLPMKTTSVIYGKRGEPIVDILRMRVIIDSNAYKNRGEDVIQAHKIFYNLFPFFNDEIRNLGKGERGCLPKRRKNGESGFLDASRILSVLNVRRQLDPEFQTAESKKILRGLKHTPLQDRGRLYQYLKGGFVFNGRQCNIDKGTLKPELANGYLPTIEIQVTTSNRHRTNEQYGQTCKETYTLFDMARTMVEEGWTEQMFNTYSLLAKSNILGTRYSGPVPELSEYAMMYKRAEAIWKVLVPKVKHFYNPEDKNRLYRQIQKELELSKNLQYYLSS